MAITSQTYEIPEWLSEHCSINFNSPYDWLNRPLLYSGTKDWAIGTDGKGYVAVSLPVTVYSTRADYLAIPNDHLNVFKDMLDFEREGYSLFDIPKFKTLMNVSQKCDICKNTGIASCNQCKGTTEASCPSCKGGGSSPCITCRKPDHCKTCDGEGVVECIKCRDRDGKIECGCLHQSNERIANLVLGNKSALFNLHLLEKLLVRIKTPCFLKLEDPISANRITIWDENQVIGLMEIKVDSGFYPKIKLDSLKIAKQKI